MIRRIGRRSDNTYLGEDDDGVLHVGKIRRAGFDELTRTIEEDEKCFRLKFFIGSSLIGKSKLSKENFDPNAPWTADKANYTVFYARYDEDGNPVMLEDGTQDVEPRTVERKTTVIEWEKLS